MAFILPELPYDYAALSPHVDEQTMKIHHDKHHQAYIDKANAALEGSEWSQKSVEEVLRHLGENSGHLPEAKHRLLRNNVGGHYNHSRFWEWMSPEGGGEPGGELGSAIAEAFGSFAEFQQKFSDAALSQFGSGWAWLVDDGGLKIVTTPNQDSPLMDGVEPLLGLDVWEHAYYLTYQNRRPDYIAAWWNVVNWEKAAEGLGR